MSAIRRCYLWFLKRKNPRKYWENAGVYFKGEVSLIQGCDFGTEPYLVEIGDHVRINNGVRFVTHDGGAWVVRKLDEKLQDVDLAGKIRVGNNVHIGTGTMIMPGVSIGNNCIIGCGAIVTHSIPDNSVAVGVPARVIESIDTYIAKHKQDFIHTKAMSAAEKKKFLLETLKDYEYRQ